MMIQFISHIEPYEYHLEMLQGLHVMPVFEHWGGASNLRTYQQLIN